MSDGGCVAPMLNSLKPKWNSLCATFVTGNAFCYYCAVALDEILNIANIVGPERNEDWAIELLALVQFSEPVQLIEKLSTIFSQAASVYKYSNFVSY